MSTPANVVLFGAGASLGSGSVMPKPPPLGADLFPVLRRLFPTVWGGLSIEHIKELERDFEAGMQRIGKENPHALPPLQRAMAAFFFDFIPGNDNLYRKLAQRIQTKSWSGALVTLNYERLLELSLIFEGVQPFIGTATNNNPSVELCLPHGCCHIFCESVRGTAQGVSFSGTNVVTRGSVKVVSDPNEFAQRIKLDAFPPVMSYFDPLKLTTSCINFIESQRSRYTELINGAEKVVIVGIRVRPHDTHLWSALAETKADLTYCSGKSGGQEFLHWAVEQRPNKINENLGDYFADSFEIICEHLSL